MFLVIVIKCSSSRVCAVDDCNQPLTGLLEHLIKVKTESEMLRENSVFAKKKSKEKTGNRADFFFATGDTGLPAAAAETELGRLVDDGPPPPPLRDRTG